MIKFDFKFAPKFGQVDAKVRQARRKVFAIAAARIRKRVVASIERRKGPSPPGRPPHTHRRTFLRRAVRFFANHEGAIIGPRESVIGPAGELHEFGGTREGAYFPPRPFMAPALASYIDEYGKDWEASIGP